MCTQIAKFKPDVVVTEKGLSDLAIHFLTKAGISAIRRLRKTGAGAHMIARSLAFIWHGVADTWQVLIDGRRR